MNNTAASNPQDTLCEGFSGPARLLVVDDDEAIRRVLVALLTQRGYVVIAADSYDEAFERLSQKDVDLVITDYQMPGKDGLELCESINHHLRDLPTILFSGAADREVVVQGLRRGVSDFLFKPVNADHLYFAVVRALEKRQLQIQNRRYRESLERLVEDKTDALRRSLQKLTETNAELNLANREMLERLSVAAEFRDDNTGAHIRRVSQYSALLARELGFDPARVEIIRLASPLHDIGKIGIPDAILLKPHRLTPSEWEVMKQHTTIGMRILTGSRSGLLQTAEVIAYTHHEKFDGSGYPRSLRGNEIPMEGRIVAIADVFDALTTERPYKPPMPVEKVWEMMMEASGSHFDPQLLRLFFGRIDKVLEIQRQTGPPHKEADAELPSLKSFSVN